MIFSTGWSSTNVYLNGQMWRVNHISFLLKTLLLRNIGTIGTSPNDDSHEHQVDGLSTNCGIRPIKCTLTEEQIREALVEKTKDALGRLTENKGRLVYLFTGQDGRPATAFFHGPELINIYNYKAIRKSPSCRQLHLKVYNLDANGYLLVPCPMVYNILRENEGVFGDPFAMKVRRKRHYRDQKQITMPLPL